MVALDVIRLFGEADPPRFSDVEIAIPFRVNATVSLLDLITEKLFCSKYSRYNGHKIPRRLFNHVRSQSIALSPSIPLLLL